MLQVRNDHDICQSPTIHYHPLYHNSTTTFHRFARHAILSLLFVFYWWLWFPHILSDRPASIEAHTMEKSHMIAWSHLFKYVLRSRYGSLWERDVHWASGLLIGSWILAWGIQRILNGCEGICPVKISPPTAQICTLHTVPPISVPGWVIEP